MADVILCPHCGRQVEISQAVAAGLRKQIESEARIALQAKEKALAEREAEAAQREAKVAALAKDAEQRIQAEVARQARAAQELAKAEAQREAAGEVGLLKQQVEAARKDRDAAQAKELELRARQEALAEKEKTLDLTLARRLDEERVRLAEGARKAVEEQYHLQLEQGRQQIAGMARTIEDLKRKAEQGSQQLQGEVQETSLEDLLRREFPGDRIEPVAKGVRGADVVQHVRGPAGAEAGVILWESKRTKNWVAEWLPKLRDDQRAMKADVAALVSQVLPAGAGPVALLDGVWVATYGAAVGLAQVLRKGLIDLSDQRRSQEGRTQKEALLYGYLTGREFKSRCEGLLEPFAQLEKELKREMDAFQRIWSARAKQIERAKRSLLGLRGDIEGLAGNVLPEIQMLGLPTGADDGEPGGA